MPTATQIRAFLAARDRRFDWAIGPRSGCTSTATHPTTGTRSRCVLAHESEADCTQRVLEVCATVRAFDRCEPDAVRAEKLAIVGIPAPWSPPVTVP